VYYDTDEEFIARLRQALVTPDIELRKRLRSDVVRYDWMTRAPDMDERMKEVANSPR